MCVQKKKQIAKRCVVNQSGETIYYLIFRKQFDREFCYEAVASIFPKKTYEFNLLSKPRK